MRYWWVRQGQDVRVQPSDIVFAYDGDAIVAVGAARPEVELEVLARPVAKQHLELPETEEAFELPAKVGLALLDLTGKRSLLIAGMQA